MFQRTPKHVKPKPEKGRLTLYIYGEKIRFQNVQENI